MNWKETVSLAELQKKKKCSIQIEGKKIALFYVNGEVRACEARCPHQGYPLIEGDITEDGCILTCQWHNWRFSLKDGSNQFHGDPLKVFQTKLQEGKVFLSIPEESKQDILAQAIEDLQQAFFRNQYGRISRTLAKLLLKDIDPAPVFAKVIEWSHDRFEFGLTHAYAAMIDWLSLSKRYQGDPERVLVAWTEAVDHISYDTLRHPTFAYQKDFKFFHGEKFFAAILEENEAESISYLLGAEKVGLSWEKLEPWLYQATLAHYRDFGHPTIYVEKIEEIFRQFGPKAGLQALKPLIRLLCNTTNENLLPDFRQYAETLSALKKIEPAKPEAQRKDAIDLPETLSINQTFRWLLEHYGKHSFQALMNRLIIGAAKHLYHFDAIFNDGTPKNIKDNVGWLHFTHALTFANVGLNVGEKYPQMQREILLQMACFYGRGTKYTDYEQDLSYTIEDSDENFFEDCYDFVFDHGNGLRIYACHYLKNTVAFEKLHRRLPQQTEKHWLQLALKRYLQESNKTKHILRDARQHLKLLS